MLVVLGYTMNTAAVDKSLVSRAQAGDPDAFDGLVRRHRSRVFKVICRFVRNRADAEDAVQEAFIKAYLSLARFRGDCAFYTWLHQIAVNCAKSAWCAHARDADVFITSSSVDDGKRPIVAEWSDAANPEGLLLAGEIISAVSTAMDKLSEELRGAILLRELQGRSYSEIALAMQCPIGTVRSRVSRARDAIDRELRDVAEDGLGRTKSAGSCVTPRKRGIIRRSELRDWTKFERNLLHGGELSCTQ
jgi:RNA polymerase sigma-70 factor (ECF subfamily)